jgi:hypothetical protein
MQEVHGRGLMGHFGAKKMFWPHIFLAKDEERR